MSREIHELCAEFWENSKSEGQRMVSSVLREFWGDEDESGDSRFCEFELALSEAFPEDHGAGESEREVVRALVGRTW